MIPIEHWNYNIKIDIRIEFDSENIKFKKKGKFKETRRDSLMILFDTKILVEILSSFKHENFTKLIPHIPTHVLQKEHSSLIKINFSTRTKTGKFQASRNTLYQIH